MLLARGSAKRIHFKHQGADLYPSPRPDQSPFAAAHLRTAATSPVQSECSLSFRNCLKSSSRKYCTFCTRYIFSRNGASGSSPSSSLVSTLGVFRPLREKSFAFTCTSHSLLSCS